MGTLHQDELFPPLPLNTLQWRGKAAGTAGRVCLQASAWLSLLQCVCFQGGQELLLENINTGFPKARVWEQLSRTHSLMLPSASELGHGPGGCCSLNPSWGRESTLHPCLLIFPAKYSMLNIACYQNRLGEESDRKFVSGQRYLSHWLVSGLHHLHMCHIIKVGWVNQN